MFSKLELMNELKRLHEEYALVPVDKACTTLSL
jgi:hypothetical protein